MGTRRPLFALFATVAMAGLLTVSTGLAILILGVVWFVFFRV